MKATLIYVKNGNGKLPDGAPLWIRVSDVGRKREIDALILGMPVEVGTKKGYPDDGKFSEIEVDLTNEELVEAFVKGTRMVKADKFVSAPNESRQALYETRLRLEGMG